MKPDVSNRHRGDLGGRLRNDRVPAKVTVEADRAVVAIPTGQHLMWMLLNLLARQSDEVGEIELAMPDGVRPAARLSPLVPSGSDLKTVLEAGVEEINPRLLGPGGESRTRVSVRIGPGPLSKDADLTLAVSATGWAGYVGQIPAETIGDGENPVGAYVGACLAAGEIFKHVRSMRDEAGTYARRMWLDAAEMRVVDEPAPGPSLPDGLRLPATIVAGVGAVANAFLHVIYPLEDLRVDLTLIDNDPEGVTDTNLNRCVLFGLRHAATFHPKASTAASLMGNGRLVVEAVDDSWQAWRDEHSDRPLDLVISVVDKNSARHAVQDALPRLILGASTNDMRAQVNLYDVLGGGPCLRCRNRPETRTSDDEIVARLKALPPAEREQEARKVCIDPEILETFLSDPLGNCGLVGGATLQKFGGGSDEVEWSVGFVSALAGVLLAAEYLKLGLGSKSPTLNARENAFRFQYWRPDKANVNAIFGTPPDAGCLCQKAVFRRALETSNMR